MAQKAKADAKQSFALCVCVCVCCVCQRRRRSSRTLVVAIVGGNKSYIRGYNFVQNTRLGKTPIPVADAARFGVDAGYQVTSKQTACFCASHSHHPLCAPLPQSCRHETRCGSTLTLSLPGPMLAFRCYGAIRSCGIWTWYVVSSAVLFLSLHRVSGLLTLVGWNLWLVDRRTNPSTLDTL